MGRLPRIVIPGIPHHVAQRGNYGQRIFFSDKDRECYLNLYIKYSMRYKLKTWGYCLMNTHVHFIIVPKDKVSLSMTFNVVNCLYSNYINKKKKAKGHCWEGKFFSCPMDDRHTYIAIRYVENNPVKSGLVNKPWDWPWSSAGMHIGRKDKYGFLEKKTILPKPSVWKDELQVHELKAVTDKFLVYTKRGLPLGSYKFIRQIEKKTGKKLKLRRPGRPVQEQMEAG